MTALVRQKAEASGEAARFRIRTCAAEELDAPSAGFDLVTIGNAFHRMQRDAIAAKVLRWLRPGGYLALLWGRGPEAGPASWQQALSDLSERWRHHAGIMDRVPAGYQAAREERPDLVILREAGFEIAGRCEFGFSHEWTADEIAGHAFSTSVLSEAALGDLAPAFTADLRRALLAAEPSGRFRQDSTFALELARRPRSAAISSSVSEVVSDARGVTGDAGSRGAGDGGVTRQQDRAGVPPPRTGAALPQARG